MVKERKSVKLSLRHSVSGCSVMLSCGEDTTTAQVQINVLRAISFSELHVRVWHPIFKTNAEQTVLYSLCHWPSDMGKSHGSLEEEEKWAL